MKKLILVVFFWLYACAGFAQNIKASSGYVKFFSSALIEDITAENRQASAYFNPETGEAVFLIPITGFVFEKSLMQEHFNENYLESDKFPEAHFKGKISGYSPGQSESAAVAEGEMTIHGVTKKISVPGKILRSGSTLRMEAVFDVALVDYDIEIPKLMFQKIAEKVAVTTHFEFQIP